MNDLSLFTRSELRALAEVLSAALARMQERCGAGGKAGAEYVKIERERDRLMEAAESTFY